jgi:hypothetical protein
MQDEETKGQMAAIADDYDRLSKDANGLATQKEREEGNSRRRRYFFMHHRKKQSRRLWRRRFRMSE